MKCPKTTIIHLRSWRCVPAILSFTNMNADAIFAYRMPISHYNINQTSLKCNQTFPRKLHYIMSIFLWIAILYDGRQRFLPILCQLGAGACMPSICILLDWEYIHPKSGDYRLLQSWKMDTLNDIWRGWGNIWTFTNFTKDLLILSLSCKRKKKPQTAQFDL